MRTVAVVHHLVQMGISQNHSSSGKRPPSPIIPSMVVLSAYSVLCASPCATLSTWPIRLIEDDKKKRSSLWVVWGGGGGISEGSEGSCVGREKEE